MREEIEARPAVILFGALALGVIFRHCPAGLLAAAASCVWLRPWTCRYLLVGAACVGVWLSPDTMPAIFEATPLSVVGTVTSVPSFYPDVQVCEFQTGDRTLLLTLDRKFPVALGDELHVSGEAKPLTSVGGATSALSGVQGRMTPFAVQVISRGPWISRLADSWRRGFGNFMESNLGPKEAALADAVCFNARNLIDLPTREEMAASGTIHILSAAGLQVFVLSAMVTMALRFLPVHRWLAICLLGLLLALYSIAAGLQPQIVRASIMAVLGLSAFVARRDPDPLSALAISGCGYLLWHPEAVFGMAFQVAFVAVGGLCLFYRQSRPGKRSTLGDFVRITNDLSRVSLIVMLSTAPLVAYYLGSISLLSVFANLLLCWSIPLIVGIGFTSYFISLVSATLGSGVAIGCLEPICRLVEGMLGRVGQDAIVIEVPGFSWVWLIAYYGAWLMTFRRRVVQP